jgi:hypothetical protein
MYLIKLLWKAIEIVDCAIPPRHSHRRHRCVPMSGDCNNRFGPFMDMEVRKLSQKVRRRRVLKCLHGRSMRHVKGGHLSPLLSSQILSAFLISKLNLLNSRLSDTIYGLGGKSSSDDDDNNGGNKMANPNKL